MANWKKGALHTHTFWSDGKSLPEAVCYIYREKLKYDFVCLTDHNIFPEESMFFPVSPKHEDVWPPPLSAEEVEFASTLRGCNIEKKRIGVRDFVKLKSFAELKSSWDIPGEFLLIGGSEISAAHYIDQESEYDEIHLNIINCLRTLLPVQGKTRAETFSMNLNLYNKAAAEEKSNSLLMVNHPFWRFWDIDPELLIEHPEIKFMEICNNCIGGEFNYSDPVNSPEKFWDFILACRLLNGDGVIYGTASDDAHNFYPETIHGNCGCNHGWVMVDCPGEMSTDNIINAMKSGNFYATCGVLFDRISFDRDSRTLSVKVHNIPGTKYHIRFITTRKGFNRHPDTVFIPGDKPIRNRTLPVIGEDVGICVKEIAGIEGSYTMSDDDLYVRAVAISDAPGELQDIFYPETLRAWTQPFTML